MIVLEPGENIVGEVRRHWFVMFGFSLILCILAVLPCISFKILSQVKELPLLPNINIIFCAFLYLLWILCLWIAFFVVWTDYYLDVWYITNRRLIDIEQKGIFNREVIYVAYDKIQDTTVETRGVIATMLGFSDIHIQTAGEQREIILHSAASPEIAKKMLNEQILKNKEQKQ